MQHPDSVSPPHRSGTVAIIGRSNVGKSTLLNVALGQQLAIVSPTPQTTRDRLLGVVRCGASQIGLLDTPGFHRPRTALGRQMNASARAAVVGADVMVFVTAVPSKPQEQLRPHPGDLTLLRDVGGDIPAVLVVNKIDLLKDKKLMLPLLEALNQTRKFEATVPISARRADGVDLLLQEVSKLLPERDHVYEEDFLTDRPLRFFAGEYIREQVFRETFQEVPHSVAVSIERFDETKECVHIDATIHCARAGHRGILVGTRGERLKSIGTAARVRIEELLERRVHLKLWVAVTSGWPDSKQALRELGYDPEGGEAHQ